MTKVECKDHPRKYVKNALKLAAEQLTSNKRTIKIVIQDTKGDHLSATLYFEMLTQAQYNVVDDIFKAIKLEAWEFFEDITVGFSKMKPR